MTQLTDKAVEQGELETASESLRFSAHFTAARVRGLDYEFAPTDAIADSALGAVASAHPALTDGAGSLIAADEIEAEMVLTTLEGEYERIRANLFT